MRHVTRRVYGYKVFFFRGSLKEGERLEDLGIDVILLTHCGRVTQICVFNTVELGTYASSP